MLITQKEKKIKLWTKKNEGGENVFKCADGGSFIKIKTMAKSLKAIKRGKGVGLGGQAGFKEWLITFLMKLEISEKQSRT